MLMVRRRQLVRRIAALPDSARVFALAWLACGKDTEIDAVTTAVQVAEDTARVGAGHDRKETR